MYIPTSIKNKVKKVHSSDLGIITEGGQVLRVKDKNFKIVSVTSGGVTVEDYISDGMMGEVQIHNLITWDKIQ